MTTSGEKAGEASGRGGKARLLLFGGLALVVLLAGGGGAAWFTGLLGSGSPGASPHEVTTADGHGDEAGAHDGGDAPAIVFVDMPDLLVNLRTESSKLRYLKLRLSLEVEGEPTAEGVRRLMPRVLDSFQLYLRALSLDDVQGAAGMQRLKEELGARVNLAVAPARVASVLLKEMLVQ